VYNKKENPRKEEKTQTSFKKIWKSLCEKKFLRNSTTTQHITLLPKNPQQQKATTLCKAHRHHHH
jgi:hypothetical protein